MKLVDDASGSPVKGGARHPSYAQACSCLDMVKISSMPHDGVDGYEYLLIFDDGERGYLDVLMEIAERGLDTPVIVFSHFGSARSILKKAIETSSLEANQSGQFCDGSSRPEIHKHNRTLLKRRLTQREKMIFSLIGQGYSSKQIAKALEISLNTVNTHRTNIISKLFLNSAAELVALAGSLSLEDKATT